MSSAEPGRRAATIYSVAQRAGVSIATVSRVLQGTTSTSEGTRRKVMQAVEELDYVPLRAARSLAVQRHEAHGLVVPELRGPYYAELLTGYESAAAALGQSVVLVVTGRRDDPTQAVRDLAGRVDGLALSYSTIADPVVQSLARTTPVVLVARQQVPGTDAVVTESTESARALTAHLFAHGRTHLVFVGDPDSSSDVQARYTGFRHAHAAADIPVRRPPLRVPFLEAAGVQVAEEILRRRVKVDGLVCANDELALAVMKRLEGSGVRVPDDIAIVGWDDVMTARYITPGLTTVRQPMREPGQTAATRLHERITGMPARPEPIVLPTELVLRSSCGCTAKDRATTAAASTPTSPTTTRGTAPPRRNTR